MWGVHLDEWLGRWLTFEPSISKIPQKDIFLFAKKSILCIHPFKIEIFAFRILGRLVRTPRPERNTGGFDRASRTARARTRRRVRRLTVVRRNQRIMAKLSLLLSAVHLCDKSSSHILKHMIIRGTHGVQVVCCK